MVYFGAEHPKGVTSFIIGHYHEYSMRRLKSTLLFALIVWPRPAAHAQPAVVDIPNAPIPMQVLAQSPAETKTDLQVICLFRSSPLNTLHGSLLETNEKLKGLLDRIRKPELFGGELGETLLLAPPKDSFGAKKLLLIGLGDTRTFSPQRMQLVGEILYSEANRLGVAHPFFAPTILDGGVANFTTGQVAEQVILGFLRAAATDRALRDANVSAGQSVAVLTYLAGSKNVSNTREGIEKAIAAAPANK
jgi:Cytosol aminopeptidase family, N-terminal domain